MLCPLKREFRLNVCLIRRSGKIQRFSAWVGLTRVFTLCARRDFELASLSDTTHVWMYQVGIWDCSGATCTATGGFTLSKLGISTPYNVLDCSGLALLDIPAASQKQTPLKSDQWCCPVWYRFIRSHVNNFCGCLASADPVNDSAWVLQTVTVREELCAIFPLSCSRG